MRPIQASSVRLFAFSGAQSRNEALHDHSSRRRVARRMRSPSGASTRPPVTSRSATAWS